MQWFLRTNVCYQLKLLLHWYGAKTEKPVELLSTDKKCIEDVLKFQLDESLRAPLVKSTTYAREKGKNGKDNVNGAKTSLKDSQVSMINARHSSKKRSL